MSGTDRFENYAVFFASTTSNSAVSQVFDYEVVFLMRFNHII
jgi:hypothetical protein